VLIVAHDGIGLDDDEFAKSGKIFEILFWPKVNSQARSHKLFVSLFSSAGTQLAPEFFLRKFVMDKYLF